jgi:hypothetical protein
MNQDYCNAWNPEIKFTMHCYLSALALVAGASALFPDCTNGPLKKVTICDPAACKPFFF